MTGGQHLRLAYFRPPTRLNPDTERRYDQNCLTVMRQVRYDLDSNRVIDMLLSLNGLPIATIELKNAFTGQRAEHAIDQYKKDRVPTPKTPLLQHKKTRFGAFCRRYRRSVHDHAPRR